MKKTFLASLMVVCLSGCSAHSGQINCKRVDIRDREGNYVLSGFHNESFDSVYEYLGPDSETLYLDGVFMYKEVVRQRTGENRGPFPINVYEKEGSEECVEYVYNRRVGPIWSVHSYYLNLPTRTVEYECIRNSLGLSYAQFREMDGAQEAFECAHKDFYHYQGPNLYLDKALKGLEYHIWYDYAETDEVEYTELGIEQSSSKS